jgi:hypothetical protein
LTRNDLILIFFAACLGYKGLGFMWGWDHKPTWKDRIVKVVGIVAYILGVLFMIAKLLLYYGTGPLIAYLMVRWLT